VSSELASGSSKSPAAFYIYLGAFLREYFIGRMFSRADFAVLVDSYIVRPSRIA
jgi:hypothetical protein